MIAPRFASSPSGPVWGGDWRKVPDSGQSYIGSGRESERCWKVSARDFKGWKLVD